MKNADKPINPIFNSEGATTVHPDWLKADGAGLIKREYFAAMAMQGLSSNVRWGESIGDDWDEYIKRLSSASVDAADALLSELEKPTNDEKLS